MKNEVIGEAARVWIGVDIVSRDEYICLKVLGVERLFLFGLIYDFWSRIYAAALKEG